MKNLVLASALGTLVGTFAIPALNGPIHYQVTKPHSLFAWVPPATSSTSVSTTLGTVPLDFVLTDVVFEGGASRIIIKANGNPVLCAGNDPGHGFIQCFLHMTTGVLIPAGSSVTVDINYGGSIPTPITLAGYVQ